MIKHIALAQMCSGTDHSENVEILRGCIEKAALGGADAIFTPEMTGMVDSNRQRAAGTIKSEAEDYVLGAARAAAMDNNIWVSLGSLALKSIEADDHSWVNRSFLINPQGEIAARYDKIHLFDVDLATGESWRESATYKGGERAVIASFDDAVLGLSICYDLRFPDLYAALSNAGANILCVPSAFTVPTGKAHWEVLLRARAIESGAFVVAAAQCGTHEDGRSTYGHSMVVDPWGEVLLDMGEELGVGFCDIDLDRISEVRSRVPAVANRRSFELPEAY